MTSVPGHFFRTAGCSIVVGVCLLLPHSVPAQGTVGETDLASISAYLKGWPFERAGDRDYALVDLKPIDSLKVLGARSDVRFYAFPTAASSLRGYVAVAVTAQGEVTAIEKPKQFNRLMRKLRLRVLDMDTAEALARDYLRLSRITGEVWYGEKGGFNFIASVNDIPFDLANPAHVVEKLDLERNYELRPPSTRPHDGGFEFRGFSWSPSDGCVAETTVSVHQDATIEQRFTVIGIAYGRYFAGAENIPLDQGPSVNALTRLAMDSDAAVRRAVARWIGVLATSEFVPHQWVVKEYGQDLIGIVQKLATDEDGIVRASAQDAVVALTSKQHAR